MILSDEEVRQLTEFAFEIYLLRWIEVDKNVHQRRNDEHTQRHIRSTRVVLSVVETLRPLVVYALTHLQLTWTRTTSCAVGTFDRPVRVIGYMATECVAPSPEVTMQGTHEGTKTVTRNVDRRVSVSSAHRFRVPQTTGSEFSGPFQCCCTCFYLLSSASGELELNNFIR